jgi:hypothetical protein
LRATLLQSFSGLRSERQVMIDRLEFDRLFRWFEGQGWRRENKSACGLSSDGKILGGATIGGPCLKLGGQFGLRHCIRPFHWPPWPRQWRRAESMVAAR